MLKLDLHPYRKKSKLDGSTSRLTSGIKVCGRACTLLTLLALLSALTTAAASAQVTPPPQAVGYRTVFDEEFDNLNISNTGTGAGYRWYNPGLSWDAPAPRNNVTASNGVLSLVWNKGQTRAYDTSISTASTDGANSTAWTYGYFEVNMAFNPISGAYPALWLLPVEGLKNAQGARGEIDIFEWQKQAPNTFYGTVHEWIGNSDVRNNSGRNWYPLPAGTNLANFNTYGMLWTPTTVSWYFNNRFMGSAPTYEIFSQQAYYLILGQQVGLNWQPPTPNIAPNTLKMKVNWVHVFQQ